MSDEESNELAHIVADDQAIAHAVTDAKMVGAFYRTLAAQDIDYDHVLDLTMHYLAMNASCNVGFIASIDDGEEMVER